MSHDLPRSIQDALGVLLRTCLSAAREDEEVAKSLRAVVAHVEGALGGATSANRQAGSSGAGSTAAGPGGKEGSPSSDTGAERASGSHTILTPPGRHRDGAPSSREDSKGDGDGRSARSGRIAEPLSVVVTRARWKAAACRLALQRRENLGASAEERSSLDAQASSREKSLRGRLSELPDTSAWMLDFPFGKRVTEEDAFDVDKEAAIKLGHVADCYETVATGAEIAMELDEAGVFRGGPPPAFLYLLAEAQSALLHSLHEAPTRIDSDQRDVFLWLKEQTTRYRIYVDRHMRLDDPADVAGSAGLQERLRRAARDAVEDRAARRERGQLLSKVRYHVGKLIDDPAPLQSEIESLKGALERWAQSGQDRKDRVLAEALRPLRGYGASVDDHAAKDELFEILSDAGVSLPEATPEDGTREHVVTPPAAGGTKAASGQDAERAKTLVAEVRSLLGDKRIHLCRPAGEPVDLDALKGELGPASLECVEVDVEGDESERWKILEEVLADENSDLILLGVRLPADEYQKFKEACLKRQTPFVRLPGSFSSSAVAHQISRQVGWRLRGRTRDDGGVQHRRS